MRPLEAGETLLYHGECRTCGTCGRSATGVEQVDRLFGFRRMGRGTGEVRPQAWCKQCRSLPRPVAPTPFEVEAWERARGEHPGVVYVAIIRERGLAKVGYTQQHPRDRISAVQTTCPDLVELVGIWGGDYFAESSVHAELHDLRVRGEWFELGANDALDLVLERDGYIFLGANDEVERAPRRERLADVHTLDLFAGEVAS